MSSIVMTDRKSTCLNSSHLVISYAVFCLKTPQSNTPASGLCADPKFHCGGQADPKGTPACPTSGPGTLRFVNDTASTEIYTLSLHDALPICSRRSSSAVDTRGTRRPYRNDRNHHT